MAFLKKVFGRSSGSPASGDTPHANHESASWDTGILKVSLLITLSLKVINFGRQDLPAECKKLCREGKISPQEAAEHFNVLLNVLWFEMKRNPEVVAVIRELIRQHDRRRKSLEAAARGEMEPTATYITPISRSDDFDAGEREFFGFATAEDARRRSFHAEPQHNSENPVSQEPCEQPAPSKDEAPPPAAEEGPPPDSADAPAKRKHKKKKKTKHRKHRHRYEEAAANDAAQEVPSDSPPAPAVVSDQTPASAPTEAPANPSAPTEKERPTSEAKPSGSGAAASPHTARKTRAERHALIRTYFPTLAPTQHAIFA
jgi:hypothetical protein